ncbi:MAG: ImmA/IrrE family metallo-endopeptidase [Dehalococcoidia bacterium]
MERGYELHDAAGLLGIELEELASIEDGRELIPVSLLDRMAQVYETTESFLLLPKAPPTMRRIPEDYRTVSGLAPRLLPDTRVCVREAWDFLEEATALFEVPSPSTVLARVPGATLDDDPASVADMERDRIGVSFEAQVAWHQREPFEGWRTAFDRLGIIVLLKRMVWEDCRGFLLWAPDVLPGLVVNSRDSNNARVFTLFHEYAHLLLREPSTCVQTEYDESRKASEEWCNAFAAAFLMPLERLDELVTRKLERRPLEDWTLGDYRGLSGNFRVSTMAMARRIRDLYGSTFYEENFALLRGFDYTKDKDSDGGPSQATIRLAEIGKPITNRLFEALRERSISNADAADLLRLSSSQMNLMERLAI